MTAFRARRIYAAPKVGMLRDSVARQRFQGLDEDQLRQVLRVARAADAAGNEAIDRQVVMVEQSTEGPRVPRLCFSHQPLDRSVVEGS